MGSRPGAARDFVGLAETILKALDASGIGMSITAHIDGELRRLFVNPAGARILGHPIEELERIPPMLPIAAEDRPRIAEMYERAIRGEPNPDLIEMDLVHEDGTRVPVEVGIASTDYEGAPAWVAFIRDISDRRRVEDALRRSEARFRELAEGAPDVITVVCDGRFVYANPAAARVLGYESVADFVARPMSEWLAPEELRRMGERLGRVLAGERLPPAEYVGRRVDGTPVSLEISSIRTEVDGRPAVLAFGRDVDERKRIQAELLQADRMATVGTLAAGVAHEINNPLTYVLFNLQRVRQRLLDGGADADLREMVDVALQGADRVKVIVKDLLAFARSETADVAAVDVVATLRSALKLADNALRHRARVETSFENVPAVRAASARLGQVFLNLLVNAAQAFDRDSTTDNLVRVSVRGAPEDRVVIEIADNGRGIDEEHVARVFEPFFTTKAAGNGTGLGLAITRAIVDSFGGHIALESRTDEGTTVRVWLPVATRRDVLEARRPELPSEVPDMARARLVVVDDEPLVGRSLRRALQDRHDVELHTDPRQALRRLLADAEPDAVICDIVMPDLTGIDLYERVRAERPGLASRFVFITGGTFTPRASEFVASTDRPVVRKPIDLGELGRAIAACVGLRRG